MIDVTTYGDTSANKIVSIDIDKIALVQRQTSGIIGKDFTALFLVGLPAFQVIESREEVKRRILEARALRVAQAEWVMRSDPEMLKPQGTLT